MSPMPPTGPRPTNMRMAMFTLKVIHIAFMVGIAMFAVVVLVLQSSAPGTPPASPPVSPPAPASGLDMQLFFVAILGAWGVIAMPATAFMVPAMRKKAGIAAADAASDEDPDAPKLGAIGPFTTGLLIRAALVEGWGLFGAVAALLTENLLFLIAPALAVVIIGAYFPTRTKFERFYTESLERASKESY